MSNQFLKLRRSAIQGRIPTTSSLELGEIALNTFDGLAFMKKSGSSGEEIVTLGTGTGGGNMTGSQYFVPVFNTTSSLVTSSIYDSGSFTAIGATAPVDGDNPDRLFVDAGDTTSYNLISGHGTINNYLQLNVQNFSSAATASSDIVATANNGGEDDYYIDMGINSSGYNDPTGVGAPNDAYLYNTGGDLLIGNTSTNKRVIIFNGGTPALDNARVYITQQGSVGINASDINNTNPETLLIEPLTGSSPSSFNNLIIGRGTIHESYLQFNLINKGTGSYASTDIVATNNIGTETSYYIDMGINSSNHIVDTTFAPGGANDSYLLSTANDLLIGSSTSGNVILWTGPDFDDKANAKLTLRNNNQHSLTGSLSATQGFTGSLFGTASFATNTLTASYVNPLVQIVQISGSLILTGSLTQNASTASFGGMVGIGTTQPTYSLEVVGPAKANRIILGGTADQGADYKIAFANNNGTVIGSFWTRSTPFGANGNDVQLGSVTNTGFAIYTNNGSPQASFHPNKGLSLGTYAITGGSYRVPPAFGLAVSGDVVIGTSDTGSYKFQVAGSGSFTNGLDVTGSLNAPSITGSLFGTASWALNTLTASTAITALTASYANNFTVAGTLTAQTIVVQTITSSTDYVTGSTRFGSLLSNTHEFTGSVSITGSLTSPNITGSLQGTASWAVSASWAPSNLTGGTANYVPLWTGASSLGTSSLFESASVLKTISGSSDVGLKLDFANNQFILGGQNLFAQITDAGLLGGNFSLYSPSAGTDNGILINYIDSTNAIISNVYLGDHSNTGNGVNFRIDDFNTKTILTQYGGSDIGLKLDFANKKYQLGNFTDATGSFLEINDTTKRVNISGSTTITGSLTVTQGITGSLFGTASWANNTLTASYVNPLRQDVILTGSLFVSSSNFINVNNFTGTAVGGIRMKVDGGGYGLVIQPSSGAGLTQINAGSIVLPDGSGNNSTIEAVGASGTMRFTSPIFSFRTTSGLLNTIYIPSTGNVLLNTTTDTRYKLYVSGSDTSGSLNIDNTLHVNSSRNVLIGTTTDAGYKLDVNGAGRVSGVLSLYRIEKDLADQNNSLQIYKAYNQTNAIIEFWGGLGSRLYYNTNALALYPSTASGVDLGTSTLWFNNVYADAIRINTSSFFATVSGSVGIGKTTANAKFDVSGSAIISGSLTVTQGITGSLFGTASWANNTLTASYVTTLNQNVLINGALTASTALISGSGTQRLTIIGSGSAQPIFTVQGSQGELFSITDSLSGSLFSVNDISGLPILEVFSDNTTLMGSYLAPSLNTTVKTTTTNSGSFTIYGVPTSSYDGMFMEYTAKSGSAARAGTFMAIWSGSSVNFTDNSTTDFGNTARLSFTGLISGGNMVITGNVTTGSGWTIKSIIRSI